MTPANYRPDLTPYAAADVRAAACPERANTRAMPRVRGVPRRSLLDLPRAYPAARAALAACGDALLRAELAAAMNAAPRAFETP